MMMAGIATVKMITVLTCDIMGLLMNKDKPRQVLRVEECLCALDQHGLYFIFSYAIVSLYLSMRWLFSVSLYHNKRIGPAVLNSS